MKIVKVWKNDYPWDIRVEKICKTLLEDGHEVHLICSNTKKQKIRENLNGLHIHRLPAIKNDLLNKICSIPAFFNPFWIYKLLKVVKNERIEIIMVRDLPLVLTGLFVGRIYKIPVIFDMAENYPAMWREQSMRGIKLYNIFFKNSKLADLMEDYVLKRVDHIIVVVEESKQRILKKDISENKISIVSNTPDLNMFNKRCNNNENIGDEKRRLKLIYTGRVGSAKRGLDTVIKAIPILSKEIDGLSLIILGDGPYLNKLKELARTLEIEQYINFCSHVDYNLMISYIHSSDICIVPHYVTEHINTTIPNKLFEYMACKKPVIVSNAVPLRRIVEKEKCGVVFESENVDSFVNAVLSLKDPKIRLEKGNNGYEAVKRTYNWQNDSKVLKQIFIQFQFKHL